MLRNSELVYDAILADINLPDMSGYDVLVKLKEVTGCEQPNLILMTGFGYDPNHSIVRASQDGLSGVLLDGDPMPGGYSVAEVRLP